MFPASTATLLLAGASLLGFALEPSAVPPGSIVRGGPPKDGIPAIRTPRFLPADGARFLQDDDRVIGLAAGGVARAYPIRILNWHEVVNDRLGVVPVAVTWCPLTASAVVFERRVGGAELTFGVSGLLYQSNVLMYDQATETLWSQLAGRAVAGPRTGTPLRALPAVETTWRDWRARHPATEVLSNVTGFLRDYDRDPYADYHRSPAFMFETSPADTRLRVKDRVLGIAIGDAAVALPEADLRRTGGAELALAGVALRVRYDAEARAARVTRADTGAAVPATWVYWFAWSAVHPGVTLWRAPGTTTREGDAPAAGRPGPAGIAVAGPGLELVRHGAYWTHLPGVGPESDHGELLVIHGAVRNRSPEPLGHVRLRYDLFDGAGRRVGRFQGFNRRAEALRPVDAPVPVALPPARVDPLPPGGMDTFRLLLPAADAGEVVRYRIRATAHRPADDRRP